MMGSETPLATARQAAAEGKLLVFAGAGISMLSPSYLPDWKGFNRALLEEIKTAALSLPNLTDEAAAVIRRLDIDSLAVEAFSDTIVRSLAGNDYFPLLKILDSDRPNAHHFAIAELGRRGACPAIVTTNFDRLLERAFAPELLEVFSTPEDFRRNPQKPCAFYKVHGSVNNASTLVDTVSQKLRGLSFPVRARLVELFREHHILVVGFSGADLDFGSDYMAVSSLKGGGRGVTWIVQPGRSLRPRAEELIGAAAGTCVAMGLSEVFTSLGVTIQTGAEAGEETQDGGQREVDRRTRAYVGDWLRSLGLGSFFSLVFCTAIAGELGWAIDARTLRNAVVNELDRSGDVPPLTASLSLARAEIALRRGHLEEAFSAYDALIAQAAADPITQAKLRRVVVASIAYVPGGRERSLRYISQILEAMARGEIPRDGSCAYVQSEAEIQKLRDIVSMIEQSKAPDLDAPESVEPDERELRTMLIRAEYEGDAMCTAVALFRLANRLYNVAGPRRQLDLAEAAMAAAERAGDRDIKIRCLLLMISALDLSGNLQGAVDAGRQILEAEAPVPEELRVRAAHSLGTVLTRIGRSGEGVLLLRSAQQTFARIGPKESYVASTVALATALAADGDRASALDVLDKAKDVIDSTGDRRAIAKRDAMVASLKAADDRSGPPPLFSDGFSYSGVAGLSFRCALLAAFMDRVPVERLQRLRRASESAADTCELAALAIRSGATRAAVEMLLEAQTSFHGNNDEEGLARCFHLLADVAHVDRRWDEAADLTRYALNVEQALEDVAGLVASHAALALQFLQVGEFNGAKWAAGESLARAAGGAASRFTAIAKYAMAEAHRLAGDELHPEAANLLYAEINAAPDLPAGSPLRLWLEDRVGRWHRSGPKSLIYSLCAKVFGGARKKKSGGLV